MFAFDIAGAQLAVTPQDTQTVGDAAYSTGLGADDYTPLLTRAFAMVLGDPLLSSINKPQFDAAMRELLPEVAGWSDDRKEQVGGTFLAVWRACAFGGAAPSPSPSRMLLNYQQQRTDVFISCTG